MILITIGGNGTAKESTKNDEIDLSIHTTVKIGVAGPDIIDYNIKTKIAEVIQGLDKKMDSTPHDYFVFSPIDEPDDRAVAEIICGLYDKPMLLDEVFSQKEEFYVNEFRDDVEKEQFQDKLDSAKLSKNQNSTDYRYIWKYVVHKCHLMIIIWDCVSDSPEYEQPRRIYKYAKEVGRSFFMINPDTLKVTENRSEDGTIESLENLNTYNKEIIDYYAIKKKSQDKFQSIIKHAKGLPEDKTQFTIPSDSINPSTEFLKPLNGFILMQGARASLLSAKYQEKHLSAIKWIASCSLLAVIIVAIQVLFIPEIYVLIIMEIFVISYIIYKLRVSQTEEWHRKWIDYRFLAECLRAYNYLYITGMKFKKLEKTPVHLSLAHRPDEWMLRAFEWISDEQTKKAPEIIPHIEIDKIRNNEKPNLFEPLKNFILNAWIIGQINYYENKQSELLKKHKNNYNWGLILFILTFIFAVGHLVLASSGIVPKPIEMFTVLLLISFPAATAALTAIRVQNEYQRNSKRYENTSNHLKKVKSGIEHAETLEELTEQVDEANEIMLREHQDWRVVFIFRELEPP